ncbi:MAG: hypothetical protein ACI8SA_000934 [Dokdonia sp.]|jgi:hypothetical protein
MGKGKSRFRTILKSGKYTYCPKTGCSTHLNQSSFPVRGGGDVTNKTKPFCLIKTVFFLFSTLIFIDKLIEINLD